MKGIGEVIVEGILSTLVACAVAACAATFASLAKYYLVVLLTMDR